MFSFIYFPAVYKNRFIICQSSGRLEKKEKKIFEAMTKNTLFIHVKVIHCRIKKIIRVKKIIKDWMDNCFFFLLHSKFYGKNYFRGS
jgi:hypothetical protein